MGASAGKSAKLILASASPRRRELMALLERPFEVEAASVDETVPDSVSIADTARYLAGIKARSVYDRHAAAGEAPLAVIGSDTVVILDGVIYGKPQDEEDAFRMLKALSGRTHEVRTGVSIISDDVLSTGVADAAISRDKRGTDGTLACAPRELSFTSSALVTFYELSDEEIRDYIATGEPFDKAGAYGVQGQGALLVRKIDGDFYTVMGLPIAALARALRHKNASA